MMMKNKKIMIVESILLLILAILVGYFAVNKEEEGRQEVEKINYVSKVEVIEDECTEEYKESQNTTVVYSSEEKVSANAILILKKYYSKCEHTINEYVELPQELVNMTKDEVQEEYPEWEVIGFESGKVTLYKEFEDVCGEHFKLKVEDGKVVIYMVNTDGTESIYEKTNISSEYLTETDLINMQDGLEIYGKEELNQIIEDFE